MEDCINDHISILQRLHDRRADQSFDIARRARTTARMQRFGQLANRLRQRRIRFVQLRFCARKNYRIGMDATIHQLTTRLSMQQPL